LEEGLVGNSSRGYKEKWDHTKIDKDRLEYLTRNVEFYLGRLQVSAARGDYLVADYYGDMFELIEELYTVLDIESLAQDNAHRYKQHKKKVVKAHGPSS
jgi:hypothetical protein